MAQLVAAKYYSLPWIMAFSFVLFTYLLVGELLPKVVTGDYHFGGTKLVLLVLEEV